MKELEYLKEMLCDEVRKINSQGELTPTTLEIADTVVDIIKDIIEITEKEEKMGYGGEMSYRGEYNGSYRSPYTSYSNNWQDNNHSSWSNNYNSYNNGNNRGYDSGYSRHTATEQMIEKLEIMKQDASSSQDKSVIQRCIDELRNK